MNVSSNFFFYLSLKPMRQAFLRGITFGGLKGIWNPISKNETGWFNLETRLKESIYQKPLHVFLLSHNLFCKSYPYANFLTIKSSTNASTKLKLSFVFPVCVSTKIQTHETESIENQPIWSISVHAKRSEEGNHWERQFWTDEKKIILDFQRYQIFSALEIENSPFRKTRRHSKLQVVMIARWSQSNFWSLRKNVFVINESRNEFSYTVQKTLP